MNHLGEDKWLLLIHNIPPKPNYFRVKVWRHLQKLGAVAIKNSVYVLPKSDLSHESFQWVMREITTGKGDATICEAAFIDGLTHGQVQSLFDAARNSEYAELCNEARRVIKKIPKNLKPGEPKRKEYDNELIKLKKRLQEIIETDFFSASGRESAEGLINEIDQKLKWTESGRAQIRNNSIPISKLQNRVWVTRKGIHIDRMACAWLIKRFIDPKAKFKFVEGKKYVLRNEELRFDMFEAEFTHEGDNCSFEVLISRTNLLDSALSEISQIIHDIDLKDQKFGRSDAVGIEKLVNGICMAHKSDEERLKRANQVFDDLYEYFKRKRE